MTAPNPSTAQAMVLVDELVRNGVEHLVLAPGSRSGPIALAAATSPLINVHVEIDERSAGFFALGIGKASRRPAVVLTTSGTAVANLLPAVIEADASHVPLLCFTADRPPELHHTGANQTIEQNVIFQRWVRWQCDLGVAEDRTGVVAYWRASVSHAVFSARNGPVHLNVAFRDPLTPMAGQPAFASQLEGRPSARPLVGAWEAPRTLGPGIESLAERFAAFERGVLVVGETPAEPGPLHLLAGRLGWPILAEALSGGRGGTAITTYHHLLGVPAFAGAHRPDFILRVGKTGLSRHLTAWMQADIPQMVLTDTDVWPDPERTAWELVLGDAAQICGDVASLIEPRGGGDWVDGWLEAEGGARRAIDTFLDSSEEPSEPRTARDTARAVPNDGTLVVASSMPVRDLDWFMEARDLAVLGNRGASGIDGFVSTAFGVGAVRRPVVALAGDLSLLHDTGGFLLADRPDCCFVVANNNGGGVFSFLPQAEITEHFESIFGTPHGRDFAKLAGFHGLSHTLIERAGDLGDAIGKALATGGVHIIEVPTDRTDNVALHRRVGELVAQAIA